MFAKFSRSWELVKASAGVLRSDKELLVFPVISGIAALIVLATFVIPIVSLKLFEGGTGPLGYVIGFLFYLCQYFVIFFFNSALVGAAMIRLNGGDPTVADGLRIARERMLPILGYAAIAATVGLLLQFLKNKDNFVIRMLGSLLGTAWTVASFLVVPVLVANKIGPIDAVKKSIELLKTTWGENAVGQLGIGFVFGFIMAGVIIMGVLLSILGFTVSPYLGGTIVVLTVLSALTVGIIQSALSGVYAAALYRFANDGVAPQGFEGMGLQTAFQAK
ncbi:MAG TPA: DUF6159 family protein [Arenimonas sp.]|nr:DUF6159 family protein [Arenimonas sp.]HOZ05977.1 DUF6159 family protein [Arenimonas sp.]